MLFKLYNNTVTIVQVLTHTLVFAFPFSRPDLDILRPFDHSCHLTSIVNSKVFMSCMQFNSVAFILKRKLSLLSLITKISKSSLYNGKKLVLLFYSNNLILFTLWEVV